MATFAFRCEAELADRARGAVLAAQRNDPSFTRDALGQLGLQLALEHMQGVLGRKRQFPRVARMKSGRASDASR